MCLCVCGACMYVCIHTYIHTHIDESQNVRYVCACVCVCVCGACMYVIIKIKKGVYFNGKEGDEGLCVSVCVYVWCMYVCMSRNQNGVSAKVQRAMRDAFYSMFSRGKAH